MKQIATNQIIGRFLALALTLASLGLAQDLIPASPPIGLTGTAVTDTVAVTKVEFYVDSSLLGTATTAPYNYFWKVPARKGGSYGIQAKAYDAAGKSAAQTITVTAQLLRLRFQW